MPTAKKKAVASPKRKTRAGQPTETGREQLADAFLARIDAAVELLPWLLHPHPVKSKSVRAGRTITRPFLEGIIAMVEAVPELRSVGRFDPQQARLALQTADAFHHVADQIDTLYRRLRFTLEAQKQEVVDAALQIYAVAQALARRGDVEDRALVSHLARLRKGMRRPRKRVKGDGT